MDKRRMKGRFFAILSISAIAAALAASGASAFDFPNPLSVFGGGEKEPQKSDRPVQAAPGAAVDCPEILVDTGAATLRVPPGADNSSVRYQLSLSHLARECTVSGDQILIKVGVEGAAVLGPNGQPGSFSGALKIAARRQKDESILASKTYHISASVPAGAARGEFRVISEPLAVPYLGAQAADDYEILVGFEGGAADKSAPAQKRRKRHARTTEASPD
ncbi:hypothetical protein [Methylosinus sp. LW4]|uniref:hypothetical protein n=1 Tax=Methylosinus sp. LW4 TaxID=136993 RepID=UPI000378010A|nr:hypothetical protein [Methylosinus sp. LW4]